jgi:hypothetical protein
VEILFVFEKPFLGNGIASSCYATSGNHEDLNQEKKNVIFQGGFIMAS